ncbi:MAG TPA: MmgE/PrpD family protein [Rhodospirillales bacterium]|jgi:2-methylcitrate dehydratase PrpD|nr:MmgE/PrpD family protein [Rhodospirillales bacterium]
MTIAGELARGIKAFRYDDLPDTAVTWAKVGILDTVGVTLAGAGEDCVSIVKRVQGIGQGISERANDGPCLIIGGGRAGPLDAALINGTASHALDFDDFAGSIGGHPSVPLVPAIIALGEMTGESRAVGGRDAITAYVAGFETESRIAHGVNFHHYEKGWHPTATLGIFGTVAASALLLDLSEEETALALCLAVSLASGVKANFGTMTKPLHVGHSVRNGMQAALMAKEGFTANPEAFEHEQGFFNVFNGPGNFDAERIFENWADPLDIIDPGLGLKQFPCCGSTHTAINCMLELVRDNGLTPGDAADIEVLANPRRLPHTDNPDPESGLKAKFSMHYIVARALLDGRVGLDHFEGDAYADKEARKLMSVVRVGAHPDMPAESDNQFGAEVIVTTTGGDKLSVRRDHELGRGPDNPMSRDELWAKFDDCAQRALPADSVLPLFEMLENLEDISSLSDLTTAMTPPRKEEKVG